MRLVFKLCIFLIVAFLFQSCLKDNNAKPIPLLYVNIDDNGFEYVQDTVYYLQKHFSGYQFQLYPNGDTAIVKSFYDGLEEGFSKKWHSNKQLAEVRFFIDGKKEGIHEAWWSNGKLKFKYQFTNNEFNGYVKEWYENGMPFKDFNYKNGYEDGSIKIWWIDGKTKTNYIIKNGRRYGLLGTKSCINVADSISFKP